MKVQVTQLIPAGVVLPFAGTSVPDGFLACNGQTVSRANYPALFAAIGTAHGNGNGTTTFHVPDYRGRFLRGVAGGQTTDPDRASRTAMNSGGATGDNVGSVQGHAFQEHLHAVNLTSGIESSPHSHQQYIHFNSSGGGGYFFSQDTGAGSNPVINPGLNTSTESANHTHTTSGNSANANASGGTAQATANETRPVNAGVNFIIKT